VFYFAEDRVFLTTAEDRRTTPFGLCSRKWDTGHLGIVQDDPCKQRPKSADKKHFLELESTTPGPILHLDAPTWQPTMQSKSLPEKDR